MSSDLPSVGDHWMHERFTKNLLNASHARELKEAVAEWALVRSCSTAIFFHCHFCNTPIKFFGVIENSVTQNEMIIGWDCYEKMHAFLTTHRIAGKLSDRKKFERDIQNHWKKIIDTHGGDETFLGWFRDQLIAGKLPEDISSILRTITRFQCAPTYREADCLVEYYMDTRKLPASVLLGHLLMHHPHVKLIPAMLTIHEAHRIAGPLAKNRQYHSMRKMQVEKEKKQRSQSVHLHEEMIHYQKSALKVVDHLLAICHKLNTARFLVTGLEDLRSKVVNLFSAAHSIGKEKAYREALRLIEEWQDQWGFTWNHYFRAVIIRKPCIPEKWDNPNFLPYRMWVEDGKDMWHREDVQEEILEYLDCPELPLGLSFCKVKFMYDENDALKGVIVLEDFGHRQEFFPKVKFTRLTKKGYIGYQGAIETVPITRLNIGGWHTVFICNEDINMRSHSSHVRKQKCIVLSHEFWTSP
ncbi:hypothetical protein HYW94_01900 [Candidatus Uhrbacteria bacterium]|nr:hypothetical protein [Candidatus Uhrbacteria bacterium]